MYMYMYIHIGLKPGQRKVLFTCFKRNDKREIKVAQLAGSVAEHSAYHHGEVHVHVHVQQHVYMDWVVCQTGCVYEES